MKREDGSYRLTRPQSDEWLQGLDNKIDEFSDKQLEQLRLIIADEQHVRRHKVTRKSRPTT